MNLLFIPVKCNFILSIQLIFQPVPKHIDLFLSNGIFGHQMSRQDFTAESTIRMIKVVILNYGKTNLFLWS